MTHPYDDLRPDDLRHADSYKWTAYAEDVLPLWVADMDFPVAPGIQTALQERLGKPIGYHLLQGDPALAALLQAHYARQGHPVLPADRYWLLPGVVPGLYASVLGLTSPGDEVLTHTPIYPPFLSAIQDHGRLPRHAPLARTRAGYEIDWDAMRAAVTPATRLLMLCNPHNPTGRLWTRAELEQLAEFALRHRLWVVSDELHADLTLEGEFTSFATLGDDIAQHTLTLGGPCKAYNTAGLGIGVAFSANAALLARVQGAARGITGYPSALAVTMWRAALTTGGPWLQDTLAYLRGNRELITAFLGSELTDVTYHPPQATYLAWLDFRAFPWADRAQEYLVTNARVGLNDGPTFGPGYEGFLRLNFATSRPLLLQALTRIRDAVRASDRS